MTAAYENMLNLLTAEFCECHKAEDRWMTAEATPKLPLDKYPQTVGGLLQVCEATMEGDLPELWTVMANASKKECIMAIQALADNHASKASSTHEAPIIMPKIYEQLNLAQLGGLDSDNLTSGLSPFLMHVGYGMESELAWERAMAFALVHAGGGTLDLVQVRELTTSAPTMATSCIILMSLFKAYATLLDLVLGMVHCIATLFWDQFIPQMDQRMHLLGTSLCYMTHAAVHDVILE